MSNDLLLASHSTVDVAKSCSNEEIIALTDEASTAFPSTTFPSCQSAWYFFRSFFRMFRMPDEWNSYALASGASFNNGSCSVDLVKKDAMGLHRCWQPKSSTKLKQRSGCGGNLLSLVGDEGPAEEVRRDLTLKWSHVITCCLGYLLCAAICAASASVPRTTYPRNQVQSTRQPPPADRAWREGHDPAMGRSSPRTQYLPEEFQGLARDPHKTIHPLKLDPPNSPQVVIGQGPGGLEGFFF